MGRGRFDSVLPAQDISQSVLVSSPFLVIAWLAIIAASGGYRAQIFGAGPDEFRTVINAAMLTAGAVGISLYLVKFQLSRGFFVLFFILGLALLLLGRWALRAAVQAAHRRGSLLKRVLISGYPSLVDEIAAVL